MSHDAMADKGGQNAVVLALNALTWIISDPVRADRLLALTGMTAEHLRSSVNDSAILAAIIHFVEGHEPDLLACAKALEVKPEELVKARIILEAS